MKTTVLTSALVAVLAILTGAAALSAAPRPSSAALPAGPVLDYLRQGFAAKEPGYAEENRGFWSHTRYPYRSAGLGSGDLVVIDNVRLMTAPEGGEVTWGAGVIDASKLQSVYFVLNSFDLRKDARYGGAQPTRPSAGVTRAMSLLARLAPHYLGANLVADPADPAAVRDELLQALVGHGQFYFEFAPGACVVGDGRGRVRSTPGLVLSLDARGREGQSYDPMGALNEDLYGALYNVVDVVDALRWSTRSDRSSTFFRLHITALQNRRLLDRVLGVAFGEQPLRTFDDDRKVFIQDYRYHTLFNSCINTSVRLANEIFGRAQGLPETLEGLPFPSAETTVYGVVGNALTAKGLATRVEDYPADLRRIMDEADDIHVESTYPAYDLSDGEAFRRGLPELDAGLNLAGGL